MPPSLSVSSSQLNDSRTGGGPQRPPVGASADLRVPILSRDYLDLVPLHSHELEAFLSFLL